MKKRFLRILSALLCLCMILPGIFGPAAAAETVKITAQPKSVAVAEGEKASATVKATGDGLTYRWYYKDAGASDYTYTASFKGNTYSVVMTAARSGRRVLCRVSDKYGNTVQSSSALLSMKAAADPVKITVQPKSVAVAEGATAKVSLTATGDGLTYTWYYKNKGAASFSKTTSFTGNSYSVKMDASRDGRQVYCQVSDKYGNTVKSNTVTLSMKAAPAPVKITVQPQSVTVAEGATAKVSLTATGDGLTYTWYYKNKGAASFSKTTSFTGNSYSVKMDASRAGRQVYCQVSDKYGNTVKSNTVTLSMKAAPAPVKITVQPKSVTVAEGETAKVTLTASGDGLTYTWYFKNKGASSFSKTTSFTSNSYSVKMDASRDGRQIYCLVKDKYGNSVKTNTVTLNMEQSDASVKIIKQPVSVAVAEGEKATVRVTAAGEGLTYQWYYKDLTQTKFYLTTTFTSNTYSVEMTQARAGRQVYCVITDKYGNKVQSDTAELMMFAVPPVISRHPAIQTGALGKWYSFDVALTGGTPPYTYQWQYFRDGFGAYRDFTAVEDGWATGYNTAKLRVLVTAEDSLNHYKYRCVITDAANHKVYSGSAWVEGNLTVASHPVDTYVGDTVSVTFRTTVAGGKEPYSYQWQYYCDKHPYWQDVTSYNNGWMSGYYTDSLGVKVYSGGNNAADGYMFRCVITDADGNTVTTNRARYLPSPVITKQPEPAWASAGGKATFTVTVDEGKEPYSYQWRVSADGGKTYTDIKDNATRFSGHYTQTLTVDPVTTTDLNGNCVYYCVIMDSYGTALTSTEVRIYQELLVTDQPDSVHASAGDTVTFQTTAVGHGTLSYRWQYTHSGLSGAYADIPTNWSKGSGQRTNKLTLKVDSSDLKNGYQYRCQIVDVFGNAVYTEDAGIYTPLVIVTQPEMARVSVGSIAQLHTEVSGGCPPYSYRWQYYDNASNGYQNVKDDGINYSGSYAGAWTDTLRVKLKSEHVSLSRCYRCCITDSLGKQIYTYLVPVTK